MNFLELFGAKKIGDEIFGNDDASRLREELKEAERKITKLEEAQKRIASLERELNRRQNAPTASNTNQYAASTDMRLKSAQNRIAYLEGEVEKYKNGSSASNTNQFIATGSAPKTYSVDILCGEEDKIFIETEYTEDWQYIEEVKRLIELEVRVVTERTECEASLKNLQTAEAAIRRKKESLLKKLKQMGWEQEPMENGGVHFTKYVDVDE